MSKNRPMVSMCICCRKSINNNKNIYFFHKNRITREKKYRFIKFLLVLKFNAHLMELNVNVDGRKKKLKTISHRITFVL